MSVIPMPLSRYRWLLQLWPLALFLLLLAWGVAEAVAWWPELVMKSVEWQRSLHQQLAQLMEMVKEQPHQAGWSLILFSLAYGVLHAVGPGHGKVVITTYLATHRSQLKTSLQLTLAASLLQGLVAIALATVVLTLLHLSSRALHVSSFWLEKGSFLLVIGLGLMLALRAIRRLWQAARRPAAAPRIQRAMPLRTATHPAPVPHHHHHEHCGCGHRHLPSADELNQADGWRTRLAIVLAMGLRPCSGALLVLLFAKVLDVFLWGVAAALVMALGTALTISLLAAAVCYCRRIVERLSRASAPAAWQRIAWATLALAGGLVLAASGVLLYLSLQPALMGGIRPFAG